jgi:hypothetical protein
MTGQLPRTGLGAGYLGNSTNLGSDANLGSGQPGRCGLRTS